ncbi:N-acetyltransferase [Neiella marina]|uniref:N-acetyltransferase n=1 Tax=Neiella holothuriorum TaxID=2870530 RepID=A0ABS7ECZ5_9GAMM|nr:GNAT family N-acetyltransferase [Neiella holothuriorum]MBW8190209.1 N-acetyltransferase [Neiella holothuriorum]
MGKDPISVELIENGGTIRIGNYAELQFSGPVEGVIDAHHTVVAPSHRGQGLAGVLFDALVNVVEKKGWKVKPSCSYIDKQFARYSELTRLVNKG